MISYFAINDEMKLFNQSVTINVGTLASTHMNTRFVLRVSDWTINVLQNIPCVMLYYIPYRVMDAITYPRPNLIKSVFVKWALFTSPHSYVSDEEDCD